MSQNFEPLTPEQCEAIRSQWQDDELDMSPDLVRRVILRLLATIDSQDRLVMELADSLKAANAKL